MNKSYFKNTKRMLLCTTFSRSSHLPKFLSNSVFYIHNGRFFIRIRMRRRYVGHKLGEFVYTRKLFYYPMRKKTKPRK